MTKKTMNRNSDSTARNNTKGNIREGDAAARAVENESNKKGCRLVGLS